MALPSNEIKQKLSRRYVEALASRAGYDIAKSESDFGNDLHIEEVGIRYRPQKRYLASGRRIFLQLKSTTQKSISIKSGHVIYKLESKNYNDLIDNKKKLATPMVLILFILPNNKGNWLTHDVSQLILRKCAYWFIPSSNKRTKNKAKITIKIPTSNFITLDFFSNYIKTYYS